MPASPRRLSVPLLSCLTLVLVAVFSGPAVAVTPDYSTIKINEVRSNPNPDFVELINTGSQPVDISGLLAVDNDPAHTPIVFAAGVTLQAGAYFSFDPDAAAITGHFGLGSADSITILKPDGTSVVDTYAWTIHRSPSFARCPNGTGDFAVTTTATPGTVNTCAPAIDPKTAIRINEVESNGDKVADWVELTNTGTSAVDISGWKILDNDASHVATPVVVPAGTTIAPGAFYAIYTEINQAPGFGLGGDDSATLYLADGTTQVDTYAWTTHAATTYGRCPDGAGAFKTTTTSTRSDANACSPVRINEIESSDPTAGPDWVELTNISDTTADISGWVIKDSTETGSYTFPTGSTIGPKAYATVDLGGDLAGLGGSDSVRLFAADGTTLVESYTWTTAAVVTYGRCKDGLGSFVDTKAATKGAANSCPGLNTEPWPGSQTVRTADLASTFMQDLSGLSFDPKDPDLLFAAQNKLGTLFKLVRGENGTWVPDTANSWGAGKTPKYLDGTGAPDTEGITVGPDGFLYASSERNNAASGVSRMSVLRYDPDATGTTLLPTDEWNLTGAIPAAGANLGLEGVTWVPDTFLTAGGFIDQSTGQAYQPSAYPLHGTGLYVVAVEDTGALHAFALDSTGGTSHLVATITSGLPNLADVTFDPERQRLWAVADDTHDGKSSLLKLQDGAFVPAEAYDRPVGMPNLNNEGFAIAPQSRCVDGSKQVLWSDDGDTGGFSLRAGTITCTAAAVTPPVTPPAPAAPADTTAPSVSVGGVVAEKLYVGTLPTATCATTDTQTGIASCVITRRVTPTRTTITATATDRAGNVSTATTAYRTRAYVVKGASYRNGTFVLARGKAYRLVGTVKAAGTVYGPARIGRTAVGSDRLRGGNATIRIPRSAKPGSQWKVLVRVGSTVHTVKITVRR